jgi:hypothetical protein
MAASAFGSVFACMTYDGASQPSDGLLISASMWANAVGVTVNRCAPDWSRGSGQS